MAKITPISPRTPFVTIVGTTGYLTADAFRILQPIRDEIAGGIGDLVGLDELRQFTFLGIPSVSRRDADEHDVTLLIAQIGELRRRVEELEAMVIL